MSHAPFLRYEAQKLWNRDFAYLVSWKSWNPGKIVNSDFAFGTRDSNLHFEISPESAERGFTKIWNRQLWLFKPYLDACKWKCREQLIQKRGVAFENTMFARAVLEIWAPEAVKTAISPILFRESLEIRKKTWSPELDIPAECS